MASNDKINEDDKGPNISERNPAQTLGGYDNDVLVPEDSTELSDDENVTKNPTKVTAKSPSENSDVKRQSGSSNLDADSDDELLGGPSNLDGVFDGSDTSTSSSSSELLDANAGGSRLRRRSRFSSRRRIPDVEELRGKLRKFLDTPRHKWVKRRVISAYTVLRVVKTIFVSGLILAFGRVVFDHIDFMSKSEEALRHLYFDGWNNLLYTKAYALYSKPEFLRHVDYVLTQFNKTAELAIGPYEVKRSDGRNPDPPKMHITYYPDLNLYPAKAQYTFNGSFVTDTITIHQVETLDPVTRKPKLEYDLKKFMKSINRSIRFDNTSLIELELHLTAIYVGSWTHLTKRSKDAFECYNLNTLITYENTKDNGQLTVDLQIDDHQRACNNQHTDPSSLLGIPIAASILVLLLSMFSCAVVSNKIIKTLKLKRDTKLFFSKKRKIELSDRELRIFLNLWDRITILSDLLLIAGCVTQFCLTYVKVTRNDSTFDYCGMMLGTGCLLSWISLIRDLDIMSTNCNVMILTLQKALYPRIVSFMGCVALLYIGFLLCGWLVLGPYLDKFSNLAITSETIFSLINGDDVFSTFSLMNNAPARIKTYGQIYLYIYLCIFIYVVVNVCISILTDAYEEIRGYLQRGFPKSVIEKFVEETEGPGVTEPEPKKGCLYPLLKHCWPIEDEVHLDAWRNTGSRAGSLIV